MNNDARQTIFSYIKNNPIATIGTINKDGHPHGSIVYVTPANENSAIYFLTKSETEKRRNMEQNPNVSVTIVNPKENNTLQANGHAFEVSDPAIINIVMDHITMAHATATDWLPPISKLRAGAYVVIGVELTSARWAQYKDKAIGDEKIFTTL